MTNSKKERSVKAVSYSDLSKIIGGDKVNKELGDKMDSSTGLGSGASNTESSAIRLNPKENALKIKKR
jgi:hypothetical protein